MASGASAVCSSFSEARRRESAKRKEEPPFPRAFLEALPYKFQFRPCCPERDHAAVPGFGRDEESGISAGQVTALMESGMREHGYGEATISCLAYRGC